MEIGSKEGWRALVDARVERPERLSLAQFSALTAEERAAYNDARIRYSQAGAFISTPQLREVKRAVHERMLINADRTVGKLGVILSGEPGQGKTTTLMQIGKEHELRRRTTGHPAGAPGKIPVVYVAVPAQCTAKELLHEFTRFLALPSPKGATYGRLVEMVAHALRECGTELVLVDDVHHLDLRYRQNVEASDMLKQLYERCGGTFVYAGIAVEDTGLLSGSREGQIRKRFALHHAEPYRIGRKDERADWGDLLLALEDSMCLLEQPQGAILDVARELHALSGGEIGLLKDTLQLAAIRAIESETEKLDQRSLTQAATALGAGAQLVGSR